MSEDCRGTAESLLTSASSNPKQIVLEGDWNAILDPKIDKAGLEQVGWTGVKAA